MLTEFEDNLAAMEQAMEAQQRLCEAAEPDHPALAHSRWQLARLGRIHAGFLTEQIFPLAQRHAETKGGAGLLALRETWPAFGGSVSAFIARWPLEAIATDWEGYRQDAAPLERNIRQRVQQERQCLYDMLAEIEGQAVSAPA
ncbi:hypothetical protein [Sphingomonas fuzhouensis]|uniref:hypothetical protein n=1 Tax=Sphingomonas fuzhouensis TaxID=3106033 RepID=UPI002B002F8E|nr:hypothetical protein [Sphingomonas sp. SGZ-02]